MGENTAFTLRLQGSKNNTGMYSDIPSLCEVYGYYNNQLLPEPNTLLFEKNRFK